MNHCVFFLPLSCLTITTRLWMSLWWLADLFLKQSLWPESVNHAVRFRKLPVKWFDYVHVLQLYPSVDDVRTSLEGYPGESWFSFVCKYIQKVHSFSAVPVLTCILVSSSGRLSPLQHPDGSETALAALLFPVSESTTTPATKQKYRGGFQTHGQAQDFV